MKIETNEVEGLTQFPIQSERSTNISYEHNNPVVFSRGRGSALLGEPEGDQALNCRSTAARPPRYLPGYSGRSGQANTTVLGFAFLQVPYSPLSPTALEDGLRWEPGQLPS